MNKSTVSIKGLEHYDPSACVDAMRELLAPLGGMSAFVHPGQTILLKPNVLSGFAVDKAVTTHPSIVRAAILLVREAGGKPIVGDSPGVGGLLRSLRGCGIDEVLRETSTPVADFETSVPFELETNRIAKRIPLAKALADADVMITLPKLKTHVQMGFTGAIKNQFGLVVGMEKAKYHYRLNQCEHLADLIIEINRIAKPVLAIMDGVIAMEGDGPSGGNPRPVGVLLAGSDLTAVDILACEIIDLPAGTLPLIQAARRYAYGETLRDHIMTVGDAPARFVLEDFRKISRRGDILRLLPLPKFCSAWLRQILAPRPGIRRDVCIQCGACARGCPLEPSAIDPTAPPGKEVDDRRCIRCYCCHEFCPVKAISLTRSRLWQHLHWPHSKGERAGNREQQSGN